MPDDLLPTTVAGVLDDSIASPAPGKPVLTGITKKGRAVWPWERQGTVGDGNMHRSHGGWHYDHMRPNMHDAIGEKGNIYEGGAPLFRVVVEAEEIRENAPTSPRGIRVLSLTRAAAGRE